MLSHGDADDVTQEVFLSAFRSIRRYRGGSFISWLLRIATNKCLDALRARSRRPFISLDRAAEGTDDAPPRQFHDPSESPEQHLLRMDLARDLEHALLQLSPEQLLLVVLSDIDGYSYEEIAASTGWPTGTVKSRLSRGRARLRDTLRSRELTIGP
jgi:RNA polymerase sigma-70 factor (ECF subfamily)